MAYRVKRFPTPFYHIIKLCLNLAILAILGLLIKYGYNLFGQPAISQGEALKGAGIFIVGIVGWILLIKLSRRGLYGDIQPSLKLTILSVVAIIIIFGLAGVQPIAGYMVYLGSIPLVWLPALWFLVNPLYGIAAIALIIWIIYTIRQ